MVWQITYHCNPSQSNWTERSDTEYGVEQINHPRRLGEDQLVSRSEDADCSKKAGRDGGAKNAKNQSTEGLTSRPSKRTGLLFQLLKTGINGMN